MHENTVLLKKGDKLSKLFDSNAHHKKEPLKTLWRIVEIPYGVYEFRFRKGKSTVDVIKKLYGQR